MNHKQQVLLNNLHHKILYDKQLTKTEKSVMADLVKLGYVEITYGAWSGNKMYKKK